MGAREKFWSLKLLLIVFLFWLAMNKEKGRFMATVLESGNAGGGRIIFGVGDDRQIIGTSSFLNIPEVKSQIYQYLKVKIEIEEFNIEK